MLQECEVDIVFKIRYIFFSTHHVRLPNIIFLYIPSLYDE